MERRIRLSALRGALFALHVQGQALLDMFFRPDAVDALLCLAKAPVGATGQAAMAGESDGQIDGPFGAGIAEAGAINAEAYPA